MNKWTHQHEGDDKASDVNTHFYLFINNGDESETGVAGEWDCSIRLRWPAHSINVTPQFVMSSSDFNSPIESNGSFLKSFSSCSIKASHCTLMFLLILSL